MAIDDEDIKEEETEEDLSEELEDDLNDDLDDEDDKKESSEEETEEEEDDDDDDYDEENEQDDLYRDPFLVENRLVRFGKLPGRIHDVPFEKGMTIEDGLRRMEMKVGNQYEIRKNGYPADKNEEVEPGDQVLLVKNWKGSK